MYVPIETLISVLQTHPLQILVFKIIYYYHY